MKGLKFCAVLMAGIYASATSFAVGPMCPAGGSATGCDTTIVINPNGSLTITPVAGSTPYDGNDDNLVGILNNSGHSVSSINLMGSGNGGGLFAFDGDGIDSYIMGSNMTDTTGYGGPQSFFTNITTTSVANDTGTINFIGGLGNGSQTYFSLESDALTATIGGGGGGGSVTPEPSTLVLLGTGALGLMTSLRRRFTGR